MEEEIEEIIEEEGEGEEELRRELIKEPRNSERETERLNVTSSPLMLCNSILIIHVLHPPPFYF